MMTEKTFHKTLLASPLALLPWSGVQPHDRFTWLLDMLLALIGAATALLTLSRCHDRSLARLERDVSDMRRIRKAGPTGVGLVLVKLLVRRHRHPADQ